MRDREDDTPARLSVASASPLARTLLCSAASDAAPERSRHRALVAASAAVASVPATSAAATGLATAKLAILKWLGAGFVLGTSGMASIELARVESLESAAPIPAVSAQRAAPHASPRPIQQPVPTRIPQLAAAAEAAQRPRGTATTSPAPAAPSRPALKDGSNPLPAYSAASAAFPVEQRASASIAVPASAPNSDPGRFAAELALVDRARRAVVEGKPHQAEALLEQLEREHRGNSFGPEVMAIRVEALIMSGNRAAAEALARQFIRAHPQHPLVPRVRSLVGAH